MLVDRRILLLLPTLFLAACGGAGPSPTPGVDVAALMPASNEVSGWERSEALRILPGDRAGLGYADGGVNGDAGPFVDKGLVTLGIGKYARSTGETIQLRVWHMGSASNASTGWTHLTTNDARYNGTNWSSASVGEVGRISDTGTYWWVLARKGAFIVEVMLDPDDAAQRNVAVAFLGAVLAKLP